MATYYVKKIDETIYMKSGSWPTSDDTSKIDLEAVVEATSNGDTVIVSGGSVGGAGVSFTGTELDADSSLSIDKKIIFKGADPSDADNGGTVTLDGDGVNGNVVVLDVDGLITDTCKFERFKLGNAANSATNYNLMAYASYWTVNDVEVYAGYRGVYCDKDTVTFNRLKVLDTGSDAVWLTASPTINGFIFENCGGTGVTSTNNNPTLNNGDIVGANSEGINKTGTGTFTCNNCQVVNTCLTNSSKYPVTNTSTGTINMVNSIGLPNPATPANLSTGGTINWTAQVKGNPRYKTGRRPGIVVFGVDDYGNLAYMQTVAAKLAAYGWKGTYALNKPSTVTDWTPIQALVAAGHTIAAHGETYSNMMTDRLGLSMTYSGAATAADCSVTGAGDYATGLSCVNDASTVIDLDLTLAANNTLDKVVTVVNAGTGTHGYTAAKRNTDGGNAVASKYLKTQSLDVKAGAKNFDLDDDRVFNGEMRDVKTAIETGIGSTINGWVCPGNASDETMRAALLSLGFTGARGDGTSSTHLMSSVNIFNITPVSLYNYFGHDANPQTTAGKVEQYTAAALEYLKWQGGIYFFYAHTTGELSAAGWDALLAEVHKSGIQVMTLDQAVSYLKTYDPSGDLATADNLTYTRTMVNATDYRLRSGSPAINAGVDVGLTTDFLGRPIIGIPDIGAYEHTPSGGSIYNLTDMTL